MNSRFGRSRKLYAGDTLRLASKLVPGGLQSRIRSRLCRNRLLRLRLDLSNLHGAGDADPDSNNRAAIDPHEAIIGGAFRGLHRTSELAVVLSRFVS